MPYHEQHARGPEDNEGLDEHAPPYLFDEPESPPPPPKPRPILSVPRRKFGLPLRNRVLQDTKEIAQLIKDINGKPKEAEVVEAQSELEKTKLTIWLIKALVWFMAVVTVLIVGLVIYSTSANVDIILPSFIADAFGAFKEIVVTIIEEKG